MPVEHPEDAVGLVTDLNVEVGDAGILHVLAPALHLAARVLDSVGALRVRRLIGLGFAEVDSHSKLILKKYGCGCFPQTL